MTRTATSSANTRASVRLRRLTYRGAGGAEPEIDRSPLTEFLHRVRLPSWQQCPRLSPASSVDLPNHQVLKQTMSRSVR
jgi:hypothetical protein